MGIPVSLILIAVGAILAFAVHPSSSGTVDVDVVGWILMGVGVVGLLLSLLLWEQFGPGSWGWHRSPYPAEGPYPPRRGSGRRTMVEEDEAPGPPPP
jgi:hypothetical protein